MAGRPCSATSSSEGSDCPSSQTVRRGGSTWAARPPAFSSASSSQVTVARPPEIVSLELRRVEFEIRSPENAPAGRVAVPGYALYYVCEDVNGTCLYRRQDVTVELDVSGNAGGR